MPAPSCLLPTSSSFSSLALSLSKQAIVGLHQREVSVHSAMCGCGCVLLCQPDLAAPPCLQLLHQIALNTPSCTPAHPHSRDVHCRLCHHAAMHASSQVLAAACWLQSSGTPPHNTLERTWMGLHSLSTRWLHAAGVVLRYVPSQQLFARASWRCKLYPQAPKALCQA